MALLAIGILLLLEFMVIGTVAIGYMIKRDMEFAKIFDFQEVWGIIQRIGVGRYLLWYFVMAALGLVAAALDLLIPWVGAPSLASSLGFLRVSLWRCSSTRRLSLLSRR